jgi:large subunit ribosomal protein L32
MPIDERYFFAIMTLVLLSKTRFWTLFMAVPKRKHSNARTGTRRSHDHKTPIQRTNCPECSTAVQTHTVCPQCGHYMGREVVKMDTKSKHFKV